MSVLSDNYKRIMSEIESKITDPNELEFVESKIEEVSIMYLNIIENLSNSTNQKIKNLEEKQKKIEDKIQEVENFVSDFENDLIEDMDGIMMNDGEYGEYDYEISCPYCSFDFVADITGINEIACPKCNNIIELDWNDEEEHSGGCCSNGGCNSCSGCPAHNQEKNKEDDDK